MNKPIIGITTRVDIVNNKKVVKVPYNIIKKVEENGGIPVIIPEINNQNDLGDLMNICQGFIIPGGITWHKTDEQIILYAIKNDIPLLGICAGMQSIGNVSNFCGSEKSDKTVKTNSQINHFEPNMEYVHKIKINNGLLYNILKKEEIMVNSRHNDKIVNDNSFEIDAYSEDGIIEAIHIPNKKFILGLQWHPEDLDDENSQKIFRKFISITNKK